MARVRRRGARGARTSFPRLRVVWFHQAARRRANATLAARFGLEPVDLAAPLSLATWQGANQALKSAALWATLPRDGHVLMLGGDAGLRAKPPAGAAARMRFEWFGYDFVGRAAAARLARRARLLQRRVLAAERVGDATAVRARRRRRRRARP